MMNHWSEKWPKQKICCARIDCKGQRQKEEHYCSNLGKEPWVWSDCGGCHVLCVVTWFEGGEGRMSWWIGYTAWEEPQRTPEGFWSEWLEGWSHCELSGGGAGIWGDDQKWVLHMQGLRLQMNCWRSRLRLTGDMSVAAISMWMVHKSDQEEMTQGAWPSLAHSSCSRGAVRRRKQLRRLKRRSQWERTGL
jgi:hypothetical protein